MDANETAARERGAGPILHWRGHDDDRVHLAALVVCPEGDDPGPLATEADEVRARAIATRAGLTAHVYEFALPRGARRRYRWRDQRHTVRTDIDGDLRIAFTSCNGKEEGDLDRDPEQRNRMWSTIAAEGERSGWHLLLNGGDQIYADEVVMAHDVSRNWPESVPDEIDEPTRTDLAEALAAAYFRRYTALFAQPGFARVAARIPSLSMWDDHDICDGWGSRPPRLLDSAVGRSLFAAARDAFLIFQCATAPDALPPLMLDPTGSSLSWAASLPGLTILAPDLRSERRPHRVMGEPGWTAFREGLDRAAQQLFVVSTVPALGPRLSLIERYMAWTPWVEKYEDDLRDQWQSHAHRDEWRAFLGDLVKVHEGGCNVAILSGEIHLATRAAMATRSGPMHQLISSGIAHPPPPGVYAGMLGLLARFGEGPLEGHPITLHPLPGRARIYSAERNYLALERRDGAWTASWQLEESGATPEMALA